MWFTGSIIAAAVTLGTFRIDGGASWRIPSAMMGLVPVLQMIIIWVRFNLNTSPANLTFRLVLARVSSLVDGQGP